jgi:glycolate oxidase
MDSFAIEAAEGFANVGYPLDAQALLLCELDGTKAQVQAELESVLKVLSGASSLKPCHHHTSQLRYWRELYSNLSHNTQQTF